MSASVTEPMSWSMVTAVAPVARHCRTAGWPAIILVGLAVKDVTAAVVTWATETRVVAVVSRYHLRLSACSLYVKPA